MRRALAAIVLLVPLTLAAQANLHVGDDLRAYLDAHPPSYKTLGPVVLPFADGTIDFYKYKADTTDADLKVLVIADKYPVGVLQSSPDGKSHILMDLDGDGSLDTECPNLVVPYWVIAQETPTSQKAGPDNVRPYFQSLYEAFQSDDGPYATGQLNRLLSTIVNDLKNVELDNRDILFSLFAYYQTSQISPVEALKALGYVTSNYLSRFKSSHPLLYLHTLESLINLGRNDQARSVLADLLSVYPPFVPALVYQWQLELDASKKANYYKGLKRDHPNHWIVKQI